MKEVYTNLFIGDDADCNVCSMNPEFSIVHACKTCHQKALGYRGALPPTHPNCLVYENGAHLYLNMVETGPNELLPKLTHPVFKSAMGFIAREIQNKKVLVHCNYGMSRSPSLGLIYLAKTGVITKKSFEEAMNKFYELYPKYAPATGRMLYLKNNWDFLVN